MTDPITAWLWLLSLAVAGGHQPILTVIAQLATWDPEYEPRARA